MRQTEKAILVDDLVARLKDAKSAVLVDYQGLSVKQLNELREKISEVGGSFSVVKNTLLKLALQKAESTKQKAEIKELEGPTALVLAEEDEIAPLQVIGHSISETDLPKLKLGFFDSNIYDAEKLLALSRLPGREALLGQLLGAVAGPQYALVNTLQGNLQKLVYVLNAKAQQSSVASGQ